jgi:hypothetical protein
MLVKAQTPGCSGAEPVDVVIELVLGFRVLHVCANDQFQAWLPQTFDPGKNLFRFADNADVQNDPGIRQ